MRNILIEKVTRDDLDARYRLRIDDGVVGEAFTSEEIVLIVDEILSRAAASKSKKVIAFDRRHRYGARYETDYFGCRARAAAPSVRR